MKLVKHGLAGLVVALVAATAPVTFQDGSMQLQQVCADGTCCPEPQSVCNIGGGDHPDKYKKACDGPCAIPCQG